MKPSQSEHEPFLHKEPSECPNCRHLIDAGTGITGSVPSPGDVSICIYCAAVLLYDENLKMFAPDQWQLDEIFKDQENRRLILRAQSLIRAYLFKSRREGAKYN